MSDIYVGPRQKANRGCFILVGAIIVLLVVVVLVVKMLFGGDHDGAPEQSVETTTAVEQTTDATTPDAPQPPHSDAGPRLLAEARSLLSENQLQEARKKLYSVLDTSQSPEIMDAARTELSALNIQLAFSPRAMEEKISYTIKPGDHMQGIARKHKSTVDLICAGNNIPLSQQNRIQAGKYLRILSGTWSIEVSKQKNILDLFLNGRFFKRYKVGTGKFGLTPEGDFKITLKQENPPWKGYPPGHPKNIIGTRWMAITSLTDPSLTGYGIHGTAAPETVGHQSSAGCIRLLNKEVEELFALVPTGTTVHITP